jgi:hypothetical protein
MIDRVSQDLQITLAGGRKYDNGECRFGQVKYYQSRKLRAERESDPRSLQHTVLLSDVMKEMLFKKSHPCLSCQWKGGIE